MFGFWSSRRIYMDHAATTLLDGRVLSVMKKVFSRHYFNPGALYREGVATDQLIDQSRVSVAKLLGTTSDHVIFTRGGTESCNMAILGTLSTIVERVDSARNPGEDRVRTIPHVITSAIEHAAVLETLKDLEKNKKIELSIIPVNNEGIIIVDEIKKALRPETVLVTVMYVNNEIGTIQPIKEIVKLVRWYKKQHSLTKYPLVHTDAIQAVNYLDMHVERLGVDLVSLSGSKIYGPKSSGVLYVRHKELMGSMFFGGDQEFGFRAGTEDVAQVIGFTKALEITRAAADSEKVRLEVLRDIFVDELKNTVEGIIVNGSLHERNANNINVTVPGISGERLVIELDAQGICAASKSACKEDDGEASHVIAAIRKEGDSLSVTDGAVRFTMGRTTTKRDVVTTVKVLKEIVDRIRIFEQTLTK
ncbi:MAG: cysteine desulfurase family protein [bacterium]